MFNVIEVTQDGHAVVDTEGLYRVVVKDTGEILEELCEESEAAAVIGVDNRCGNTDAAHAVDYRGNVVQVRERDWSRKKPAPTDPIEIAKHAEAKRISELSQVLELQYEATAALSVEKVEGESRGHQYHLKSKEVCEFPSFGFEVWVDDRDNDGDLAQSVVDKVFDIADDYRELAETVAGRLQRNRPVEAVEPAA